MIASIIAGMTLGLSVALPFGPMSLVCVQRSIADGVRYGLVTGMGAASAHGLFATAALVGRDAVSAELVRWSEPTRWFSAALLFWLGLRTLLRRGRPTGQATRTHIPAAYGSGLVLGLSNPMTILPYLALASGAAAGTTTDPLFSSWSVPGVMTGALAWYAVLSTVFTVLRPGLLRVMLRPLDLIAGSILVVFAIRVALG